MSAPCPAPQIQAAITIQTLNLRFPIFQSGGRSLKKMLFHWGRSRLSGTAQSQTGTTMVDALHDLSLHMTAGERVGLVGHNGAGKSTLLRVMAGIYLPDSPHVTIQGHVAALLSLNAGMQPSLTGRDNITLFGHQQGFDRRRIRQLEDDVEAFAGLGSFMDLPVRLYSSGMSIRLGFGLATAVTPDILLMDEWFMAGDAHFQAMAEQRLTRLVNATQIVVMTSHALDVLEKWCTRILWLEAGRIVRDGPAPDVLAAYRAATEG